MAIDTYNKLQAAIADTVNRDDLSADVTAFSPTQIDGAINAPSLTPKRRFSATSCRVVA